MARLGNPRPIPIDEEAIAVATLGVVDALHEQFAGWEKQNPSEAREPYGPTPPHGSVLPPRIFSFQRHVGPEKGKKRRTFLLVKLDVNDAQRVVLRGGAGMMGGSPVVILTLNGRYSPRALAHFAAGGAGSLLYREVLSTMRHEVTHLSDPGLDLTKPASYGNAPPLGKATEAFIEAYYNEPTEVRAFLQEVVSDVKAFVHKAWQAVRPKDLLRRAIEESEAYNMLAAHLHPKNNQKILSAAARAVTEQLELEKKEVYVDITLTSSVDAGHTHTLTIPGMDRAELPRRSHRYLTSRDHGHVHSVEVTKTHIDEMHAGAPVHVLTSVARGHTHSFELAVPGPWPPPRSLGRQTNPKALPAPKDAWARAGLRKPKPLEAKAFGAGKGVDPLEPLLQKLRKGADASLSMPKLIVVAEALGWSVEPVEMVVQARDHGAFPGEPGKEYDGSGDRTATEAWRDRMKERSVEERPTHLEPGKEAVYGVSEVHCHPNGHSATGESCEFTYFRVVGVVGLRFTDTRGQSFEVAPSERDRMAERPVTSVQPYTILPRLKKESSWFADINQRLGTEPHVTGRVRTREGTGTCWFCWRNIKLDDRQTMVHHGYERPGYGEIVGDCAGVHESPYELRVEPGRTALAIHQNKVDGCRKYLARLRAGDVKVLEGYRGTVRRPSGVPGWQRRTEKLEKETVEWLGVSAWEEAIAQEIKEWLSREAFEELQAKLYAHATKTWKQHPLPTEKSFEGEHYDRLVRELK